MNNNTTPLPGTQLTELINDASIDCIIALDVNKKIIAWNRKTEIVTGLGRAEAMGNDFYDIFPKTKESKEISKAITQALNGHTVFVPAEKNNYIDGYYEDHFIPLTNKEHVVGILIIKHDVSHRIKNENELKALNVALVRKNKKLQQLNAEMLNFSSVAGNDLKEPLWRSYSLLETVLHETPDIPEKAKNYLKRVQMLLRRMNLLTDDLAQYLKLQRTDETPRAVDMNQVLKAVLLQLKDTISERSAVIEHDTLPAIKGYSTLISQLFHNLLNNALKFQADGNQPRVSITSTTTDEHTPGHPEATEDKYIVVTFKDNGIGIERAHQDKIFQMFYKADNNAYPGRGIGLAICNKIMDMHHGFITVQSNAGDGTSFSCYFPVKK